MSTNYTKQLASLNLSHVAEAGGKAAGLGEMIQLNMPVPSGFALLTSAFTEVLRLSGVSAELAKILKIHPANTKIDLGQVAKHLQNAIGNVGMPSEIFQDITQAYYALGADFVAVRSSACVEDGAAATWAGQLESYLNVNSAALESSIRRCWQSIFSKRALMYWAGRVGSPVNFSMGVVIQTMVQAEAAGVAFSIDPLTGRNDQVVIEAVYGLGEALVGGHITPDRYVVVKPSMEIVTRVISNHPRMLVGAPSGGTHWVDRHNAKGQVLQDLQIRELVAHIVGLENHWGRPIDVEWALVNGGIVVVQCRPVTTRL